MSLGLGDLNKLRQNSFPLDCLSADVSNLTYEEWQTLKPDPAELQ